MTLLEALSVLAAGAGAGAVNAVIGSGTLITFPVLLAVGYAPVTANVTNTVGLVAGGWSGAVEYRHELAGRRARILPLVAASASGAAAGAALLLTVSEEAFEIVVPVLIAVALVLVVAQPRIAAAVAARRRPGQPDGGRPVQTGIAITGAYGGYFGAGQGILLFALLGSVLPEDLRYVNALRNLLSAVNNTVAAGIFVVVADVRPGAAALIAAGAAVGAIGGARVGRRLSDAALRGIVVAVGLAAIAQLVL